MKALFLRCAFVVAVSLGSGSTALAQVKSVSAIVQPEPSTLMLGINQQNSTQRIGGKIYESLLRYDRDLNPLPNLAKSWTVSADGKIYTFTLQDNVKWHDGVAFSAEDVVFSTSKFLMETHPRAKAVFSHAARIYAPDATTVVFELKEPFEPFIMSFETSTAPIVPKHIYEGTDFKTNPANDKPIGTGPFKLDTWERGSFIKLVRNPDYWAKGKPLIDELIFKVIPDAATRALAVESGDVDIAQSPDLEYFDMARLKDMPNLQLDRSGTEFFGPMNWLEFNLRKEPFSNPKFRQAVMYALDRGFIRDNIWFGFAKVATGPIASSTRFRSDDVTTYDFDPAKAKALLDEIGLKPDANGVRVSFDLMPLPYGETWTRLAEFVRQSLAEIGIDARIANVDQATWAQRYANWEFDATFTFTFQYGDPSIGVARNYISSNIRKGVLFTNTSGYSNPKVDELFDRAGKAPTAEERAQLFAEVQKIMTEDVPVIWLLEMEFPTVHSKRVKDVIRSATGMNDGFADLDLAP